jgi:signal peptidase II
MTYKYKYFSGLIFILFCIITDQASKLYLISHLKNTLGMKLTILPFFDCVFAWNHGASFSLFAEYHQYSNIGFFILNSLITLYIIWLFITSQYSMEVFSYSLLIGGALGNLIDRIIHGAVFDFIRIHYADYDFPIFNLADSYITIGSIVLLLQFFINKNSDTKNI